MSRCPTCGRFPIDIEQRAKEWADDLNENKSLVKDNAALRVDLAAALAQLAEKDAEAKRLREAVEWASREVLSSLSGNVLRQDFVDELRRRADTAMKRGKE